MRRAWLLLLPAAICLGGAWLPGCGRESDRVEAAPDLVGTWRVDVEAFRASFVRMVERQEGFLPDEEAERTRARVLQQVHDRFSTLWARFTFHEDGSFESEGSDSPLAGRWSIHGERLSLTVTEGVGVESAEPDVWSGTVRSGVIRLRPEADKDYEITLRPEP